MEFEVIYVKKEPSQYRSATKPIERISSIKFECNPSQLYARFLAETCGDYIVPKESDIVEVYGRK